MARIEFDDDELRRLALLVELVRPAEAAPAETRAWLNVESAAAYLDCGRKRIYDLVSQRRVRFAKEGGRLVFRREWLDELTEET